MAVSHKKTKKEKYISTLHAMIAYPGEYATLTLFYCCGNGSVPKIFYQMNTPFR